MHTLPSLDMSSLTFEQWIMFPWSFPNQFLWLNCQALASAPSKQTAASCNLHKVLFSFLWNAFPCSSPHNPFLIRTDNFCCDFPSSGLSCLMAILFLPCNSEIAGTNPAATRSEHDPVLCLTFLRLGTSWWLLWPVWGCRVCAELGNKSLGVAKFLWEMHITWAMVSITLNKVVTESIENGLDFACSEPFCWGEDPHSTKSHWSLPGEHRSRATGGVTHVRAVCDTEVWATGLRNSSGEHRIYPTALKMDQLKILAAVPKSIQRGSSTASRHTLLCSAALAIY